VITATDGNVTHPFLLTRPVPPFGQQFETAVRQPWGEDAGVLPGSI
jgi:hypothetical protein